MQYCVAPNGTFGRLAPTVPQSLAPGMPDASPGHESRYRVEGRGSPLPTAPGAGWLALVLGKTAALALMLSRPEPKFPFWAHQARPAMTLPTNCAGRDWFCRLGISPKRAGGSTCRFWPKISNMLDDGSRLIRMAPYDPQARTDSAVSHDRWQRKLAQACAHCVISPEHPRDCQQ